MTKQLNNNWALTSIGHFQDCRGNLSVAEFGIHFDFKIERIFYLSDIVHNEQRGGHAHEDLRQFVLCLSGSFEIVLDNGRHNKSSYTMSNDGIGIFINGLVWRTMSNFTNDAVMLVLCDRIYDDDVVIRDYKEYLAKLDENEYEAK